MTFYFSNDIINKSLGYNFKQFLCRGIAQLVEQRSPKPRAEGSSPSAPARYEKPVLSGNAEVQAFLYLNN